MIDVHILTMPNDNQDWFAQCLASLKEEPICVHQVPGKLEDIGNARADAFKLGNSEYVSFVDPDDYVLPGGFEQCYQQLEAHPEADAAYTFEYTAGIAGKYAVHQQPHEWAHHLVVFRRSAIEEHEALLRSWMWPAKQSEIQLVVGELKKQPNKVIEIPEPYYVWRRHIGSFITKKKLGRTS